MKNKKNVKKRASKVQSSKKNFQIYINIITRKKIFNFLAIFVVLVIFINSLTQLYENREAILSKFGIEKKFIILKKDRVPAHHQSRYLVNPLEKSDRQIPPKDIKNLKLSGGEEIYGKWSSPFDWNVTGIHSILLPDETVMTFGSYAIQKKESGKSIKENKKLILTDGWALERDKGNFQWKHHDVQGGVDFDIWNPKKGVGDDSHILFKKPLVLDAFCSVVRVLDLENVFILGGNFQPAGRGMDSQKATTFYNVKTQKFIKGKDLNYERWYGSIVRTHDDRFIMMGGSDIKQNVEGGNKKELYSEIPEILEKDSLGNYSWRILPKAKSKDFFADVDSDEWSYPKAFLVSDGNIIGISYNKIWVMEKNEEYRIIKTGEIPLETGGIKNLVKHIDPNNHDKNDELKILTVGAAVGSGSSTIMIDKDKIIQLGGQQKGGEYSPSNRVYEIDFAVSKNPKIKNLRSMNHVRNNANATILPDGKVFVNGGHASYHDDLKFSIFIPELYDPSNNSWEELSEATFRRNYHSTSLLLTDGTILVAGGDVWNAEIFYPPYLFEKNWEGKTILAKRPEIKKIDKNIKDRSKVIIKVDDNTNIDQLNIISTGSTTHAQSSELKFRKLKFKKIQNNNIIFEIPENKNELQNGTYMIFVINNNGVPSKGKIVYIG